MPFLITLKINSTLVQHQPESNQKTEENKEKINHDESTDYDEELDRLNGSKKQKLSPQMYKRFLNPKIETEKFFLNRKVVSVPKESSSNASLSLQRKNAQKSKKSIQHKFQII